MDRRVIGEQARQQREQDEHDQHEHGAVAEPDPRDAPGRGPSGGGAVGPQVGAHERLRGDRHGVQRQCREEPQLHADLVRAEGGRADTRRDGRRREGADLERAAAQNEVAVGDQLLGHERPVDAQAHPLAAQRGDEQGARDGLGDDVGPRRADQAEPGRVDQDRGQGGRDQEREGHEPHGALGVLHRAHPALARTRDQEEGRAEDRDAQPLGGGSGDGRGVAHRRGQGPREELDEHDHRQARGESDPGALHAFGDGPGPVARAEAARGAGGGAVGEDRPDERGEAHEGSAQRETGQRDRPEMPDDGRVDQEVDRLGGEDDERRQRERGDPAVRRRALARGRPAGLAESELGAHEGLLSPSSSSSSSRYGLGSPA